MRNTSPSRRWTLSPASHSAAEIEAEWHRMAERLKPYAGQTIDTIVVSGNDRTRRQTIVREMATRQGAPLAPELVKRDAAYLRGMGFFSDVDISASSTTPGSCRVDVLIVERPGLF
ncbi:MAG TPA: hypothetical protein ENO08_06950, partial [Candidatus Eisenbacteria bacterium]|nr:hypothetical protein [Candidatus Eisenbacteria bacterium]